MWISERLRQEDAPALSLTGTVTRAENGRVDVDSFMQLSGVECVGSFGLSGLPAVGDRVLVVPAARGYYCVGRVDSPKGAPGEVELRAGNAWIRLSPEGSVSINGLVISPEGKILPSGQPL